MPSTLEALLNYDPAFAPVVPGWPGDAASPAFRVTPVGGIQVLQTNVSTGWPVYESAYQRILAAVPTISDSITSVINSIRYGGPIAAPASATASKAVSPISASSFGIGTLIVIALGALLLLKR